MPDNPREDDFERASSSLSEGLRSCRSVVDNYRAMIVGDRPHADNDDSDIGDYVSTTGETSEAYEGDSAAN